MNTIEDRIKGMEDQVEEIKSILIDLLQDHNEAPEGSEYEGHCYEDCQCSVSGSPVIIHAYDLALEEAEQYPSLIGLLAAASITAMENDWVEAEAYINEALARLEG